MKISNLKMHPTSQLDRQRGLMAWLSMVVEDCLVLDCVALRKSKDKKYSLSFPARRDGLGKVHHYFHPRNEEARLRIEKQVFSILDLTQPE